MTLIDGADGDLDMIVVRVHSEVEDGRARGGEIPGVAVPSLSNEVSDQLEGAA